MNKIDDWCGNKCLPDYISDSNQGSGYIGVSKGRKERPQIQTSFNFMQFSGKFGKIMYWHIHLRKIPNPWFQI